MTLTITQASFETLQAHACDAYPDECCGFVVERAAHEEVVRVANVQDQLHATDPDQYPRTARIAYTMGPEAAPILLGAERGELTLRVFYHSHPDHDAYFSAEDRRQALGGWDEPSYPEAMHLVMSVRDGHAGAVKAFAWDTTARDFVEIPLVIEP